MLHQSREFHGIESDSAALVTPEQMVRYDSQIRVTKLVKPMAIQIGV
jgi:hypothetical protein